MISDHFCAVDLWVYGDDGEKTLLCDWEQSDIRNSSFLQMTAVSPELICYSMRDPVTKRLCVGKLTPEEPGAYERKLVRIAAAEAAGERLALQVLEFNRNSTEFHARLTLYSENTESVESVTQVLGKDILNGNIPDVILCGRPDINASYEGKYRRSAYARNSCL